MQVVHKVMITHNRNLGKDRKLASQISVTAKPFCDNLNDSGAMSCGVFFSSRPDDPARSPPSTSVPGLDKRRVASW